MRIVVVGVGGVGMAHICAAGRLGLEVVGLIDANSSILRKSQSRWINQWGDITEEVEVQPNVTYSEDIRILSRLDLKEDDLIILATPPHTHKALIRICLDFSKAKILVEKPISDQIYSMWNQGRLIVSSEWVFHQGLQEVGIIKEVGMAYPCSHATDWGYKLHPLLDFGPHLFSILLSKEYEIIFTVKGCILSNYFEMGVDCIIDNARSRIEFWGDRRDHDQGLFINKEKIDWQDNLFDLQLAYIQEHGKGIVDWQEMLGWENQVKKFL